MQNDAKRILQRWKENEKNIEIRHTDVIDKIIAIAFSMG